MIKIGLSVLELFHVVRQTDAALLIGAPRGYDHAQKVMLPMVNNEAPCHKRHEVQLHVLLMSALVGGVSFTLLPLYSQKETLSTHCIGGWEGSRTGLDAVARIKIFDHAGNGTPAIQSEPASTQCAADEAPVLPVVGF